MSKLIKEFAVLILFAYLAIWLTFLIIFNLDLRFASGVISRIEEIFLIQLSIVLWLVSLLFFYVLRILIYFIVKKFFPKPSKDGP